MCADSQNEVEESLEDNNCYITSLIVKPALPDLVIDKFEVIQQPGSDTLGYRGTILNAGAATDPLLNIVWKVSVLREDGSEVLGGGIFNGYSKALLENGVYTKH